MEELSVSFNSQDQAPDDLVSLDVYVEELSVSFNTQDQVPDDFYDQDRCCDPSIFDEHSRKGIQLIGRFLTKQDISHFFFHLVSQDSTQELFERSISTNHGGSRIEFQSCRLWIRFASQGVICFHSVDFGGHPQDNQYVSCFFVDNPHRGCQVLPRLHTTQLHTSHLALFPSTSVTRQCTGTL